MLLDSSKNAPDGGERGTLERGDEERK